MYNHGVLNPVGFRSGTCPSFTALEMVKDVVRAQQCRKRNTTYVNGGADPGSNPICLGNILELTRGSEPF